ncbi:MAG: RagB/SusD family nutrient uptake outer membrane protein [Alistipes sp.]|nr:RagB/SusD family nutrient uptake outer membrane protein [Alistipes sp.]
MNNITKFSTLALAAAMAFTGCIKETQPTTVVTSDAVAQSSTAVEAMVNAIPVAEALPYSVYGSGQNRGFDFGLPGIMCATDAATGDVVGTSGDANSGYNWFWFFEVGTRLNSNAYVSSFTWYCYWNFIKSCNDIISIVVDPQTDDMKAFLAYAKANRAALYLDLARSFDPLENNYTDVSMVKGLTVPLITETTTEAEARNNPRLPRQEMFDFIFSDLDEAEALLTGNSHSAGKDVPSLAVVYGLKARAYLWLGGFDSSNYAKAAEYARKAIDTSGATILTEAQWLDPKTGFNTPNNSWMWYVPQSPEGVTNLVNFVAWRSCEATWGYGQLVQQGVHVNFYNRISDTDWRKRAFIGPDPDAWYAENTAISNFNAADFGVEKFSDYFSPYATVKFRPANGETLDYKSGNPTSICMMRVEEMILTEIEALAYTNPAEAAAKLVAFVQTRDPQYMLAATSTEAVVEAAIWQKRIELWGEGIVFYDMKRLNYSIETGYPGTNVATDSRINTDGRAPWWNFVIPEAEVIQNTVLKDTNNPEPSDLIPNWVEE